MDVPGSAALRACGTWTFGQAQVSSEQKTARKKGTLVLPDRTVEIKLLALPRIIR